LKVDSFESQTEFYLCELLKTVSKESCQVSRKRLEDELGLYQETLGEIKLLKLIEDNEKEDCLKSQKLIERELEKIPFEEPREVYILPILGVKALDDLRNKKEIDAPETTKRFFQNPDNLQEIRKIKKKIDELRKLYKGSIFQDYITVKSLEDDDHTRVMAWIEQCHLQCDEYLAHSDLLVSLDLKRYASKKGRPSNKNLNEYILELAKLYQDLSGEKFTSDIHINDDNQNVPITPGMNFVWVAIDSLYHVNEIDKENDAIFPSSALSNACEAARSILKNQTLK